MSGEPARPTWPRVLVLTDRHQLPPGRDLVATLRRCAAAGLEAVVLRELDLPLDRRAGLATGLADTGLTVVSAHAVLPGARAVHLPGTTPPPRDGTPWGRSCHTVDDVRRAAAEGASYATLSPFAATASKPGYGPPVDPAGYAEDHGVPVLALGGIDPSTVRAARAAGAHGVAVMGAVMRADDPASVVSQLIEGACP